MNKLEVGSQVIVISLDSDDKLMTDLEIDDVGVITSMPYGSDELFTLEFNNNGIEEVFLYAEQFKVIESEYVTIGGEYVVTGRKYWRHNFNIGDIIKCIRRCERGSYEFTDGKIKQTLHKDDIKLYVEPVKKLDVVTFVEGTVVADFLMIGNITIAIPKGCPYGVSQRYLDDELCELTGQSVSLMRLLEDSKEKGLHNAIFKKI